jgi:hypothetical protein
LVHLSPSKIRNFAVKPYIYFGFLPHSDAFIVATYSTPIDKNWNGGPVGNDQTLRQGGDAWFFFYTAGQQTRFEGVAGNEEQWQVDGNVSIIPEYNGCSTVGDVPMRDGQGNIIKNQCGKVVTTATGVPKFYAQGGGSTAPATISVTDSAFTLLAPGGHDESKHYPAIDLTIRFSTNLYRDGVQQ